VNEQSLGRPDSITLEGQIQVTAALIRDKEYPQASQALKPIRKDLKQKTDAIIDAEKMSYAQVSFRKVKTEWKQYYREHSQLLTAFNTTESELNSLIAQNNFSTASVALGKLQQQYEDKLSQATDTVRSDKVEQDRLAEQARQERVLKEKQAKKERISKAKKDKAYKLIRSLKSKMKTIPAGSFNMGDLSGEGEDDEKPVHTVKLKSFKLSKTEVTVSEFRQFVKATGYRTDAEKGTGGKLGCYGYKDDEHDEQGWRADYNWKSPGFDQTDNHPVTCVSFNDAKAFINWINKYSNKTFRLPSESQWEYAARAGSKTKFYFGNDSKSLCEYGNILDKTPNSEGQTWIKGADCKGGYFSGTSSVGKYKSNQFGLKDMLGNIWEWNRDCWKDSYQNAPADGTARISSGDCSKRVLRGGSWINGPGSLGSANRFRSSPGHRNYSFGFRLLQV
jgi:formylglycine-generating enzyme required for sulfatase activity